MGSSSSGSGSALVSGNVVNTGAPSPLKALVSAELGVVLGPLDKFLTALQMPGVNTQAVIQQFGELQLAELQQAPLIESIGIQGVASAAQTKLHSWVNDLTASAASAASAK